MRHLWVRIQVSASGGSSMFSPNATSGHLIHTTSTITQNIVSNVPHVITSLLRRERGTRFSLFGDFSVGTDKPLIQHYDAVHGWIECPECDREFGTQEALDQVQAHPSTPRLPADGILAL